MSRPKNDELKFVSNVIKLKAEDLEELENLSSELQVSFSAVVKMAVKFGLDSGIKPNFEKDNRKSFQLRIPKDMDAKASKIAEELGIDKLLLLEFYLLLLIKKK